MSDLVRDVERVIAERRLLRRGQALLVAVSGGLDSMVLMHLLQTLAPRHRWRLTVAHFNHQLRGRNSDLDHAFVRRAASKLGLPIVGGNGDVRRRSRLDKISLEMAARQMRHAFLAEQASRLNIARIALAHHADDQVELFFLRLLRGAGNEGLGGMKWESPSPADLSVRVIRPLLDMPRERLVAYALANRIRHREDETNAMRAFLRNRVRHELLPLLRREYQPGLDRVVRRLMTLAGAEADFATRAAREWLAAPDKRPFAQLHEAVQRRCVQCQLHEQGIVADFDLVERLRCLRGKRMTVDPRQNVWLDAGGVLHREVAPPPEPTGAGGETVPVELTSPRGRIEFAGVSFDWRFMRKARATPISMCDGQECFDAAKIGPVVVLRHWWPGDRFQPSGLPRPVKLQDLFTNLKIPREDRHRIVVAATAAGEVFWVEKLRISERFKVNDSTARLLLWRWNRREIQALRVKPHRGSLAHL